MKEGGESEKRRKKGKKKAGEQLQARQEDSKTGGSDAIGVCKFEKRDEGFSITEATSRTKMSR